MPRRLTFRLLMLTVFLIPLMAYINVGQFPIFLGYLLIYLTGLIWLLKTQGRQMVIPSLILPILVFILSVVNSVLVVQDYIDYIAKVWHLLSALLLYFLVTNIVRNEDQADRLTKVILLSGVCVALIGIIQYVIINVLGHTELVDKMMLDWGDFLYGSRQAEGFRQSREIGQYYAWLKGFFGDFRATALFGGPNENGTFSAITLLVGFAYLRRHKLTIWMALGGTLILLNLILTQSRSSFVAFAAGLVFIFLLREKQRRRGLGLRLSRRALTTICVIFLMFLLLIPAIAVTTGLERFWLAVSSIVTLNDGGSAASRFATWTEGLNVFLTNPILGVGFGAYANEGGAHDMFLNLGIETGILGLIGYMGWMWLASWQSWRIAKRTKSETIRMVGVAGLATVVSFAASGIAGGQYLSPKLMPLIWTVMGLVSYGLRSCRTERRVTISSNGDMTRVLGPRDISLPVSEQRL